MQVVVVSNDRTPGFGLPVAAPGLRAYGLAEGLRAHGLDVRTVVPRRILERDRTGAVPPPIPPHTDVLDNGSLAAYLAARAPVTAILINSNQVDELSPMPGVRFVLDFFAPKVLERVYEVDAGYVTESLSELRRRKLDAIRLADAFIVNGAKKVPYFAAWLLHAGRDLATSPLPVVDMPVPVLTKRVRDDGEVRLLIGGYAQAWNSMGAAVPVLAKQLDEHPQLHVHLVWRRHWGVGASVHDATDDFAELESHERVHVHGAMILSDFRALLTEVDVAVDLFAHTLEREYAMVTRTAVALASGIPVVHPTFTEVSPIVRDHGAGWLVDIDDLDGLAATIDGVVTDPRGYAAAVEGAARAAREVFDPARAVRPLVGLLDGLAP